MPVFTVHVPSGVADPMRRAERTIFLREGFSWSAFLLGPLALLYRRLWLAALAWAVLAAAIVAAGMLIPFEPVFTAALLGLLALFTGLEAGTLWRGALGRRRFAVAGVVASASRDEAERRFFADGEPAPPRGIPSPASRDPSRRDAAPRVSAQGADGQPAVIGLFPEGP